MHAVSSLLLHLGLANLGTEDEEVLEDIKNILYTDSAVAGEAAGIGMGLLLAGSASDKAQVRSVGSWLEKHSDIQALAHHVVVAAAVRWAELAGYMHHGRQTISTRNDECAFCRCFVLRLVKISMFTVYL